MNFGIQRKKKWIWVDPQFCLLAKDSAGNYLSLFEIHKLSGLKIKVNWVFFGTSKHEFYSTNPSTHPLYKPDQFRSIIMTMGNRVFLEDAWNKKLYFLPKDLGQAILILIGVHPKYELFGFNTDYARGVTKVRTIILGLMSIYSVINFYLIFLLYRKRSRYSSNKLN